MAVPIAGSSQEQSEAGQANTKEHLLQLIDAQNRLAANLAAERFALCSNRAPPTVLASHYGTNVLKYSDGRFCVVSLPIVKPLDEGVLCLYTELFNTWHIANADERIKAGKYKEAADLYRVLLHFARCDDLYKEVLERRLPLLEQLAQGRNVRTNLVRLREMDTYYAGATPFADFSRIETAASEIVTNILQVRLP